MSRWARFFLWLGGIAALIVAVLVLNGFRGRLGWTADAEPPDEIAALIGPAMRWTVPDGAGPHPVALLLSGCNGPQSNLDRLARDLLAAGWASVIVDSHSPRELDEAQLWRLVCAGQVLNGAERAADIAVTLAMVRGRPELDAGHVALIGLSHGGWTSLDYLALALESTLPPLLTAWPEAIQDDPLAGIRNAIFFYPYCGPAGRGLSEELPSDISYLFQLVEGDIIANEARCFEIAGRLLSVDADVSVTVYEGVTHNFDDPEQSFLSPLAFDAAARDAATAATLRALGPP
ncbi:MAG: dienelactone hydrolase [Pseudomonadota bacterium]